MRKYEIEIGKIAGSLGTGCTDVEVKWETASCGDITCYKNTANTLIVVEIPDGCNDRCFYGIAKCTTACEGASVARIKICPCVTDADCTSCQECDSDLGYCIDICPDGQFCGTDGCVECNDANPCPNGKECVNGECKCPSDRPHLLGGACVPCLPGGCDPGQRCTDNGCEDIPCPTGQLFSTALNNCVDCLTSVNCKPGQVCNPDGTCGCPEGSHWNPLLERCEADGCQTDDDCAGCLSCDVQSGGCVEPQCPNGEYMNPDTCGCVRECNCADPDCGPNNKCVQDSQGRCFCTPCADLPEGSCDETPEEDPEVPCTDEFTVESTDCADSCTIKSEFVSNNTCACDKITAYSHVYAVTADTLSFKVELFKGTGVVTDLSRLDQVEKEDIAINEMATSGAIDLSYEYRYAILNGNGNVTEGGMSSRITLGSQSISGKGFVEFNGINMPSIGDVVDQDKVITDVYVFVEKSSWGFPNGCQYSEGSTIAVHNYSDNTLFTGTGLTATASTEVLSSPSSRYPLFTYWRSADASYTADEIVRSVYVGPSSGKTYTDVVYGPNNPLVGQEYPLTAARNEGLLISNRYWKVTQDCSCDDNKVKDLGKVIFCSPCAVEGELKNCGSAFAITDFPTPCPVNQDLTQFTDENGNTYSNDHDAQVKWDLYINGSAVATIRHDSANGMVNDATNQAIAGFEFEALDGATITSVQLKHIHDTEGKCTIDIPVAAQVVSVDFDIECNTGLLYDVIVPVVQNGSTIVSVSPSIQTTTQGIVNGINSWVIKLTKNTTTALEFTFENGCKVEKEFNENCCDDMIIKDVNNVSNCQGEYEISVGIEGGIAPYVYSWVDSSGSSVGSTNTITGTVAVDTLVTLTVTDASSSCKKVQDFLIKNTAVPSVTIDYEPQGCEGTSTEITVYVTPGGDGTIDYSITGGLNAPFNGTLNIAGGQSTQLTNVVPGSTYIFNNLNIDGCAYSYTETVTTTQLNGGQLGISLDKESACQNDNVAINMTGPTGANVILQRISGGTIYEVGTYTLPQSTVSDNLGTLSGTVIYKVLGSSSNECPVTAAEDTIEVLEGSSFTGASGNCVDGTRQFVFSTIVSSVVDQDGNQLDIAASGAGSIVLIPNTVTQIVVTPVIVNCGAGTKTFNLGDDWQSCPCDSYVTNMEYSLNGGAFVPYSISTAIDSGDAVILRAVPSQGTGCSYVWTGVPTAPGNTDTVAFEAEGGQTYAISVEVTCNLNNGQNSCPSTGSAVFIAGANCDCSILAVSNAPLQITYTLTGASCSDATGIELLDPNGIVIQTLPVQTTNSVNVSDGGTYTLRLVGLAGSCPLVQATVDVACLPVAVNADSIIPLGGIVSYGHNPAGSAGMPADGEPLYNQFQINIGAISVTLSTEHCAYVDTAGSSPAIRFPVNVGIPDNTNNPLRITSRNTLVAPDPTVITYADSGCLGFADQGDGTGGTSSTGGVSEMRDMSFGLPSGLSCFGLKLNDFDDASSGRVESIENISPAFTEFVEETPSWADTQGNTVAIPSAADQFGSIRWDDPSETLSMGLRKRSGGVLVFSEFIICSC